MLNRTLLVPPVWLGHAIPFISFDKMYDRLVQARKTGLEHCRIQPKHLPIPQECLGGYWEYTIVSWDFLVNMDKIANFQPIVDRWETSYTWLEQYLGIRKDRDIYFIKDAKLYEYRIYDSADDTEALNKFEKRLNIADLKKAAEKYRLVHFGSLFGTLRLRTTMAETYAARSLARQSMKLQNPYLDEIADVIRNRLGGPTAYFGLHLRLGNGIFQKEAMRNAQAVFMEMCRKQLDLSEDLIEGLIKESNSLHERGTIVAKKAAKNSMITTTPAHHLDQHGESQQIPEAISGKQLFGKRNGSRSQSIRDDPHDSQPPLAHIASPSNSPLDSSLSCRGSYHADPRMLVLNTPVFLATDSKIPSMDPALQIFFNTFPCLFTLADFSNSQPTTINKKPIVQLMKFNGLINGEDGVPLAGFFYPLVDAMAAAKGRDILGTTGVSRVFLLLLKWSAI